MRPSTLTSSIGDANGGLVAAGRRQLQRLAKTLRLDPRDPSERLRDAIGGVLGGGDTAQAAGSPGQPANRQLLLRAVGGCSGGPPSQQEPVRVPTGMELILGRGRFGVTCQQVSRCQARLEVLAATDPPRVELTILGRWECVRVVRAAHLPTASPGSLRPGKGERLQLFHGDAIALGVS